LNGMKSVVRSNLLCELEMKQDEFENIRLDDCTKKIIDAANKFYRRKEEMLGSEFMSQLERVSVLQTIDDKWREHLRVMDELKEGIHLRAYGQKDPLLEYKGEAFNLFMDLIKEVNSESVNFAFKYFPPMAEQEIRTSARAPREARRGADGVPRLRRSSIVNTSALQFSHPSETPAFLTAQAQGGDGGSQVAEAPAVVRTYKRTEKQIGRNELCPCGSGKKYKHCHGRA
jgi:preprotein translocase subunit SecA